MSVKVEKKQKPTPGFVGHANPHPENQESDGVHNGVKTSASRSQAEVKPASSGRTLRALKAGTHGSQIHADGSSQAEPHKHGKTRGYPTKDEQ